MTARAKAAGTPMTLGEIRARQMLYVDSGTHIDTREEMRASLRIVVDILDAERALSAELAAALENMQRAAVLLHNHIAANTDYSEVLVQSCYADARAALAKARGEREV